MYRKIIIIVISVFMISAGTITQALVAFLFVIVFVVLNLLYMPYSYKTLNIMEILSLLACMITIYCGLFFLSHYPEVYNSDDNKVKEADNGCKSSFMICSTNG